MSKVEVKVEGYDALLKRLKELSERYPDAIGAALYQEGLAVDAASVKRTPVDTGRLRATHYVAPPTLVEEGVVVVEIGNATDYAVPVHERLDVYHRVGEAKFLEKSLNERASGFMERVAKRTERNMKRGIGALPLRAPPSPDDPGARPSEKHRLVKRDGKNEWRGPKKGTG